MDKDAEISSRPATDRTPLGIKWRDVALLTGRTGFARNVTQTILRNGPIESVGAPQRPLHPDYQAIPLSPPTAGCLRPKNVTHHEVIAS